MDNGLWAPHRSNLIRICVDQLADAMREEFYTDPQGRRVRAKHAARVRIGNKQQYLWDDIRTAEHGHMQIATQQRRQQIVGDCVQLKRDVDSYNENRQPPAPIQIELDFTADVAEVEALRETVDAAA
jgi:hypothetical protein